MSRSFIVSQPQCVAAFIDLIKRRRGKKRVSPVGGACRLETVPESVCERHNQINPINPINPINQ